MGRVKGLASVLDVQSFILLEKIGGKEGVGCLKVDVQGQRSGRILDVGGQDEWEEGLENWTIFMNAICV